MVRKNSTNPIQLIRKELGNTVLDAEVLHADPLDAFAQAIIARGQYLLQEDDFDPELAKKITDAHDQQAAIVLAMRPSFAALDREILRASFTQMNADTVEEELAEWAETYPDLA